MEVRISTLLLCVVLSGVCAINVDIPQEMYEFATGDSITLPCNFQPSAANPGLVVISWTAMDVQADAEETTVIAHYHPAGVTDIGSVYKGRVSLDLDVAKGKADLKLSSITLLDNKVFKCRVQIPGDDEDKPSDTARLVVLGAPSQPICEVQGTVEYGQNINLTCFSEEGSPPPTYGWEQRVSDMPVIMDPQTTDEGGILSLYNISTNTSGYFVCTSINKIDSAQCNITLSVLPPSMDGGPSPV